MKFKSRRRRGNLSDMPSILECKSMADLSGTVYLVTGANGGLGPAVVSALREAGADVITTARRGEVQIHADLTSATAASELVQQVIQQRRHLDGIVHCLGAFSGGQDTAGAALESWQQMMDVNFYSAVYLFRAALPELRKGPASRILAIGSRAVQEPMANAAAYAASKAALTSLVQTIAAEAENSGLTANVISPGTIDTPANRQAMPNADPSRWVQPSAIGGLAVWLCSPAGGAINGKVFPLYGG